MRLRPLPVFLATAALLLAACGGDDEDSSAAADGVLTGPGVTAETITLGVMTDGSGPFKENSLAIGVGHQIWVSDVNAAGGVCGRQIRLETRDHGYKAELAKVQFSDVEPKVAGFLQLLGSPMLIALLGDIDSAAVTTTAVSWSSQLLDQANIMVVGTTYDVEIINGLSYLLKEGMIAEGDTIGHIYIDGEYGGNGLRGAQYFAKAHDLTLVEKKVTPTDTDMAGIVTSLKGSGVKAIALTGTPTQGTSAASANKALGLDVPLIGNLPVFTPTALDSPAAAALDKLYLVASTVPFGADVPRAQDIAQKYEAADTAALPAYTVNHGYALGLIWQQILQRACDAKDLSRAGIAAAKNASTEIDTEGLIPELDFSVPGSPTSRAAYIAVPDKAQQGGVRLIEPSFTSADAAAYKAPHEG
ncbi:MAG: ABC transporter substrate-binding protein [Sporichthyaceae bacterium]